MKWIRGRRECGDKGQWNKTADALCKPRLIALEEQSVPIGGHCKPRRHFTGVDHKLRKVNSAGKLVKNEFFN